MHSSEIAAARATSFTLPEPISAPPANSRTKPGRALYWLFTPGWKNFGFALRTACAAITSLLIAMWMELDSPQWAPLTVWVVAVSSRGESLSKARWRIAGTLVGSVAAMALIAAFPQQALLFFCALGLWIGLCCGLGSLLGNYRAYGLVLTGFTSAIVATGAINDPEHVFGVAVARTSYILLGVVCEAAFAMLLAPAMPDTARAALLRRLRQAFEMTGDAVTGLVAGYHDYMGDDLQDGARPVQSHVALRAALDELVTFSGQVEFSENEMEPASRSGDHARAALAAMLTMLSRAQALSFMCPGMRGPEGQRLVRSSLAAAFPAVPSNLVHDAASLAVNPDKHQPSPVTRPAGTGAAADPEVTDQSVPGHDVPGHAVAQSLVNALRSATEAALAEIAAAEHSGHGDRFRFQHVSARDALDALANGLRACFVVLAAWGFWEVTAWPGGTSFIAYAVLVHGLVATREHPKQASIPFLKGGIWCAVVGAVLVLLVIPMVTAPETLALVLVVPMTIGGLAARDSRTAGHAFPFNMFLPVLLGPMNLGRDDEVSFFNNALAFLMAVLLVVLAYHLITRLAFASDMGRIEASLHHRLQVLASADCTMTERQWLRVCAARLVRLLRSPESGMRAPSIGRQRRGQGHQGDASCSPEDRVLQSMQVQLAAMTAGTALIQLRETVARPGLSPELRRVVRLFLHRWRDAPAMVESRLPLLSAGLRRWGARPRAEGDSAAAQEILAAFMVISCAGKVGKQPS